MAGSSVSAANSPPVITSNGGGVSANLSVAENTAAVTTVTATDPDAGQSLTYSISGGEDAARFVINDVTGALTFSPAPNFEAPTDANGNNVYVVIVQASDGNGGTDTQTLNVTVTNTNEPPVITSSGGGVSANVSVAENTTAVTTVTAGDPEGGVVSYSISGGVDAARFSLNASTGALNFLTPPNFEAPADANSDNVYVLNVRAADFFGNADQQTLNVTVTNANEPPVITSNGGGVSANVSVAENTAAVTTVTATDPDAGHSLTYFISGGEDAARFTINTTNGALSFVTPPNFEVPTDANGDNVYAVTAQVSDGNGGTDTQTLNVTVTNTNEPPVITSNGGGVSANVSVAENTTAVTIVMAADPEGGAITYAINGGADAGHFTINATNGVLSFVAPPSFEAPTDANGDNVYEVIARATDPQGNLDQQTLSVAVADISDMPFIKQVGADTFELSITGVAGAPYALEFTASLASPLSWQSIITNYAGPAGLWIVTNVSTSPMGFYRIRLIP